MKPERWQQLDRLFHAALEREPEERAAFLDEACAGDESLRKQVEALLAGHEKAGSFIESPALEVAARGVAAAQGRAKEEISAGETISHYRIIAPLGVGGMGQVYLAHDTTLGRKVALKLLPAEFSRNTDRVRRFQQEARAASSLNHQNIITIYEIGQVDDRQFIASEYVEGLTLREYLAGDQSPHASGERHPGLQLYETLGIAMQIADALAAAHAKGIVHRDIKPENIMLVQDRHLMEKESFVKLLDFGIAKLTEPLVSERTVDATTKVLVNTHEGSVIGTASYMSPEQARGEVVDARTDVWSLGVVIYEMLSRRPPFGGDTSQDVIAAILRDEPPQLSSEVPDRLRWIVEKALRRNREERYQTAREMFSDLRELQKQPGHSFEEPVVVTRDDARRTSSSAEFLVSELKRRRGAAIIVLAAVLVAAAGVAFGLFRLSRHQSQAVNQKQPAPVVPLQQMKMGRLTTNGKATAAAISPDGKYVVHVVEDGQQQSLWIRQVSTSSNVQINPPAAVDYNGLTFSPSGDYLYYLLWDKKSFVSLYQMPLFGGTAKKLLTDIDSGITFSPEGKQFAFLRGYPTQGVTAVLVANADGTSERKLTTHGLALGPFGGPAWSPDGKVIAYPAENTDDHGDFMTLIGVQVGDGSEKPISSHRWSRLGRMAWLRDGSGLVFTANENIASPSQLWYVSYPSGEVHRITNDLNDYLDVSLTADSSALVTVQSEQVSNIWVAPNENPSRSNQITSSKFDGLKSFSWTPDGKIVYDSAATGHLDLWVSEANGSGQKQLTADAGNNSWPSVSPDGRYVVFVSDRTGTNHVWRIEIDGSNATQLTKGTGESNPECSPDGRWVVFNTKSSDAPVLILKVPLSGGEPLPIKAKDNAGVAISPDGKWIASRHYEPENINTAIYAFDGTKPPKFLDIGAYYFRWTPDGRSLAFVDDRNPSAIIAQPINGGPPKQLADFKPDHIFSFAWSRDGKQLAVAHGTLTHDVILINDFVARR
jgi:eukaryotic-like serine/threonine-protein kinase